MLTVFFKYRGVVHSDFLPEDQTINTKYDLSVIRHLREQIRLWKENSLISHYDNAPSHKAKVLEMSYRKYHRRLTVNRLGEIQLSNMATILEQNQNEDNTIRQMSTIKFDEPLNVTVILGDDEDDLEEPANNDKNVYDITNNPAESLNILHEVETTTASNTTTATTTNTTIATDILKENCNKESCKTIGGGTLNTNTVEHTSNYAIATIDPLEIVSDNLINYIKLYSFYQSHYYNHESTQKRLKYIKELYFCLSYHITIEYMLPKENEQDFLINFIWKTRERSKMNISHISLYNLLSELLQWTKQKCTENENKMRHFGTRHNNESNLTDSNKHKLKPNFESIANKKNNNLSNIANQNTINAGDPKINDKNNDIRTDGKSKTCLFRAGEPGKEYSISINNETLESLYNISKNKNNPKPIRKQPRKRKSQNVDTGLGQQHIFTSHKEKPCHIVKQVVRSMFFPAQGKCEKSQVKIAAHTNKNECNESNIAITNIDNHKGPSKNYKTGTDRNSTTCLFTAGKPVQELSININTETIVNLENITNNKSDSEFQRKRAFKRKSNELVKKSVLRKLLANESDKSNTGCKDNKNQDDQHPDLTDQMYNIATT